MAKEQYVLEFKFLRFKGAWANSVPVQLPQGVAYRSDEKEHSTLMVVVELEPGNFKTLTFTVSPNELVGVSVPENLVFIPKVDPPAVQNEVDPKLIFT